MRAIFRFRPPRCAASRRLVATETPTGSKKDGQQGGSGDDKGVENKVAVTPSDEKATTTTQPSYLGYLSGVISTVWPYGSSPPSADGSSDRVVKVAVKKATRADVGAKTDALVRKLLASTSTSSRLMRLGELSAHLLEFPASRMIAIEQRLLVPMLLRIAETSIDTLLQEEARQVLALVGFSSPPKGKGIRILSIDGGGTRGILGLEVLDELEKQSGNKKICELFDIITGVSTGAILATLLGAKRMNVDECKRIYLEISRQLFSQGRLSGVSGLLLSHSYYNSKMWVEILKKILGDDVAVIHTSRSPDSPKLAIVSSIVNAPQLQPYVFRNYEHPAGRDSHFRGGSKAKLYEAVQCSSAAPGYFAEVPIDTIVHQDGGVLVNNPTAIALHEARNLWPNEPIHCVVSVGNGRSVAELELTAVKTSTRIQDKISRIIDSATDTELVHLAMMDLLPTDSYFRLNPYMSFPYTLDEIDPEKLVQMRRDSLLYVRRNRKKIARAAVRLTERPSLKTSVERTLFDLRAHWGMYKV
uniref:PNPLA domain-containing protein n=1 Tax=Panagrellus redivivus TaxID=6233 RepID=A0A7E4VIG2_PANRE